MASCVSITNVTVLDNPAMFLNPFQLEISYESLLPLNYDLEWNLIYVGCAEDESYDQVLQTVHVGPVKVGNYRFVLQADPPEVELIRSEDLLGVAAIVLSCSYRGREFIRVGYYVSNQYVQQELIEEPPSIVAIDKVQRFVLASMPRVSRFPISFQTCSTIQCDSNSSDGYGDEDEDDDDCGDVVDLLELFG